MFLRLAYEEWNRDRSRSDRLSFDDFLELKTKVLMGFKDWAHFRAYKKLLGVAVDYGCKFKDGKCNSSEDHGEWGEHCCIDCAKSLGYFITSVDTHNLDPKYLDTYETLWDKEHGFLGDNGCVLPIEARSFTCLQHSCTVAAERAVVTYEEPRLDKVCRASDKTLTCGKRLYRKPEIEKVILADTGTMALAGCKGTKGSGIPGKDKKECQVPNCKFNLAS